MRNWKVILNPFSWLIGYVEYLGNLDSYRYRTDDYKPIPESEEVKFYKWEEWE